MDLQRERPYEAFSRESIRAAFRAWDSVQELNVHPLAESAAVRVRQQAAGYAHTPFGRGLALRETLRAAMEALRPDGGEPELGQKRWRSYVILTQQFLQGRTPDCIAADLNISRRMFYIEQQQAMGRVAEILCQWEEEAHLGETIPTGWPDSAPLSTARFEHSMLFMAPPRSSPMLVGRDDLLAELKRLLLDGQDVALTALQGLPGVGKTTLATELAHDPEVRSHFSDGVLWVGLGRQPDVLALLGGWAAAVRVPAEGIARHTSLAERARAIHTAIGTHHMLLVVDDAWHISDALAFKVGGPNCAHLITTRLASVAMDFAGERTLTVRELGDTEGLSLLAQLAPRAVEGEREEAAALVRAVGGLPLALVLMGGHLRKQSHGDQPRRLRQALEQLQEAETRLRLAQPQSPLEQQPSLASNIPLSLQASIGLSDAALDATARRALRDLSLFPPKPNTFSEEAALAVTNVSTSVLDTLVDHGLVESVEPDRYALHQTISDYTRLKSVDLETAQRLVNYFVREATEYSADYIRLDRELNNILTSLQAAHDIHLHTALIQGINALCPFLVNRGLYTIAEQHLHRASQAARTTDDIPGLTKVLRNIGGIAIGRGQYIEAEQCFQESLILAQASHVRQAEADSLLNLGRIARRQADYIKAQTYLEEALRISQEIGDRQGEGLAFRALGVFLTDRGDHDSAIRHSEQALRIFHEIGDRGAECRALNNLGVLYTGLGNYVAAMDCYQQALLIQRETRERLGEAMLLANLGEVADCQGNYEEAIAYLEQALIIGREIGELRGVGITLNTLGDVLANLGDRVRAKTYFEQALCIFREIGARQLEAEGLDKLGRLAHQFGDHEAARDYCQQSLLIAQEVNSRSIQGNVLTSLGHAWAGLERWTEATTTYQQALALRRELRQSQTAVDTLAGLARVFLAQGDLAQAQSSVDEILKHLEVESIEGAEEPLRIHLTCYQVLCANHDPRARDVLTAGYNLLQERAARISDGALRHSFLENVPAHRELLAVWGNGQ
jgi:tetratricopeptide (TPR) repeat protein